MINRYLLDEHVHPEYRAQILRREPNLTVFIIGDPGAPAKGTLDPDLLRWCADNDSVLVTNNRKSMPGHLADHLADDHHIPGIFTLNSDMSIGETVDELILLAKASFDNEFRDNIIYLPFT
jgi:Domain of unknown function (DUF5615)